MHQSTKFAISLGIVVAGVGAAAPAEANYAWIGNSNLGGSTGFETTIGRIDTDYWWRAGLGVPQTILYYMEFHANNPSTGTAQYGGIGVMERYIGDPENARQPGGDPTRTRSNNVPMSYFVFTNGSHGYEFKETERIYTGTSDNPRVVGVEQYQGNNWLGYVIDTRGKKYYNNREQFPMGNTVAYANFLVLQASGVMRTVKWSQNQAATNAGANNFYDMKRSTSPSFGSRAFSLVTAATGSNIVINSTSGAPVGYQTGSPRSWFAKFYK